MVEEFEYNGKAMGTDYSIAIICSTRTLADKIYEMAKKDIEDAESRFSRFLPESELSQLNENKKMIVSPIFLQLTKRAYQLFEKTHGIFNPLVQVSRLGYDKNFTELENVHSSSTDEPYDIDFSTVVINQDKSEIILSDGQKIDYGGLLKGYLAEMIAKKIKANFPEVIGVIMNLGGDIHTEGLDENNQKFIFSIYNPVFKNEATSVNLFNQSLATSGTYKRTWSSGGKKIHHILAESGYNNPDTDIVSASVIHKDGACTDAYTKVFLSMDSNLAEVLLQDNSLSYIIIKNDGSIIKKIHENIL